MKISYLLSWPLEYRGGVEKKIETQVRAWEKAGHTVSVHVICGPKAERSALEVDAVFLHRKKADLWGLGKRRAADLAFREASRQIRESGADLVYYRLSYPTTEIVRLGKSVPMVVEVNNDNFREIERNFGDRPLSRLYLSWYLKRSYPKLVEVASGFVGVTNELLEIPYLRGGSAKRVCIPNSVNLESYEVLGPRAESELDLPRVAFLGGAEHPEGIRRILDLAKATQGKLEFSVFGLNFSSQVPPNVTVHGYMQPAEYEPLLEACDVGLSTLTFHRKGLKEAASLKVREYLARGLPVILAHQDAAFAEIPTFILQIPDTPSNVETHVDQVVEFAHQMRGRRVRHHEVRDFIGSDVSESRRLEFFELCR